MKILFAVIAALLAIVLGCISDEIVDHALEKRRMTVDERFSAQMLVRGIIYGFIFILLIHFT